MSTDPERNGAGRPMTVEQLREQIAEDRRELTETVTALQDKTDVRQLARERVVDAEIAAAALASRAGRTAGAAAGFARRSAAATAGQVKDKTSQPVRLALVGSTAIVAAATAVAVRRRRHGGSHRRSHRASHRGC
ncbi:DUF3618 domain-containing protein [Catenulispora subtropica]|uniref:DUF3618 domain-containing protein n=1 Tax=Catenulispora subtropica TaxID=450798 RepID=A0ABP5DZR0_9ACTN